MKKGFTLIELLAVIVILAIIALIATPIILGIIEDARKGSIEASANGYIDAVEYQIARLEIKGEETSSGVYDVHQLDIDLDGEKPTYGEVIIENGSVREANLCIDGKIVEYKNNIPKVTNSCSSLYKEELLNGADPIVKGELVPVTIKADGTVIKADQINKWYSYENKEWANAVILFDGKSYRTGEEIPEESIKEYYVWIPRYAYKLWNVDGDKLEDAEKPIEIVFGDKAKTTGENNGDIYIHPAFENFGTQGIWVGKFETSYNEKTYTDSTTFLKMNTNYKLATNSNNIIIKPNVRNLTNKQPSEFYPLLYNTHRNLDSHMMTNMEWGAIAYLTNSIYGRCDSNTCTEITLNNINTGYYSLNKKFPDDWNYGATITGCAAEPGTYEFISNADKCVNNYNSEKGYLASTTGNITGIYDMVGGSWEYVMAFLVQPDGTIFSGQNNLLNSGYKGIYGCPGCNNDISGLTENTTGLDLPNNKYYNTYKNNYDLSTDNWFDYKEGKLGDATKEVSSKKTSIDDGSSGLWFGDQAKFVTAASPWYHRGGGWDYAEQSGIMTFRPFDGSRNPHITTRVVLAFK